MRTKTLILSLLLLSGCARYQSEIAVGSTRFKLPKDLYASYLRVTVPTTNGVAELVATNLNAKMNPVVIDKVTQHDVSLINATGNQIGKFIESGIQGAK